jgi:hypothetical protein
MEFVRKKKRGQNQKVRRTWFSEEGYRIVWRREVYGVRVPARFQACVRFLVPCSDGQLRPMWDFVSFHRRLMKTMKAAQEECEKHRHLWTKACEATGIRALKDLFGGKLPSGLPLWARKRMDRRLYAIVTDNRPDKYRTNDEEEEPCAESSSPAYDVPGPGGPTRTSECFASPTEATSESPTPVSPAEGKDGSTTRRTRRARSKDTETSDASAAPSAKEAGKGRKKPAGRRTKAVSKRPAKRKANTTGSSDSAKPRSRGSRKTKLLPSAS